MHTNEPEMAKKWEKEENVGEVEYHTWPENSEPHPVGDHHKDEVDEAAKRDYKDEYKKFQSSPKSKKYRAELNKYNRKKGTYGNGDGKDASHKGGKISGFEKESVNRGRAEKSRLKKEQKLREVIRKIIDEDFAGAYPENQRKKFDNTRRKQSEVLGYKLTGKNDVKTEIDDATIKEGNVGISTKKGKTIELTHKKSGKEIVVVNNPSVLKKYAKMGYLISMPEQKLTEGPKFDEVKANMEKTMGVLVKKMGLKSIGRHLVGKGGMSFFLDDPKEAKKLQKYLQAKIKDVRIINLDKEGGDESNFVVYAKVFDF